MRTSPFPALILLAACSSTPAGTGGGTTGAAVSSSAGTSGGGHGGAGQGGGGHGGAVGACDTCAGACVDLANDAQNCGACGHACPPKQQCDRGACGMPACLVLGLICPNDHLCCGNECCPPWKMCCNVTGADAPTCVDLDAGACPSACCP
jgi:hypothetical protein